jgi:hypothetical protein
MDGLPSLSTMAHFWENKFRGPYYGFFDLQGFQKQPSAPLRDYFTHQRMYHEPAMDILSSLVNEEIRLNA